MIFLRRHRIYLLWTAFSAAVLCAAFATYGLYLAASREIASQSTKALEQARAEIVAQIQSETDRVRLSVLKELASFHLDGLGQVMQRWDELDENIIGTFQWELATGFSCDAKTAGLLEKQKGLPDLWSAFRKWRDSHPTVVGGVPELVGDYRVLFFPTRSNPLFPDAELRYQEENLDILAHEGKRADPWAGWAASSTDANTPWVFWYQTGPEDKIRGCLLDAGSLIRRLRNTSLNTQFARGRIVPVSEMQGAATLREDLAGVPGHVLALDECELFRAKSGSLRFNAIIAAILFALFLLGGVALAMHTRRETRDAERKTNFVAQVSHELRTPLTSIRMYADFLGQPEIADAKRLKFAATVAKESSRLESLVERLLTFSAVQQKAVKVDCAPTDVAKLLQEIVEETQYKLEAAGLEVAIAFAAADAQAVTDPSILKQALLNVLDNATKYAREGRKVSIRLHREGDLLAIDIEDFGPGIPHTARHRLFEPFFQANRDLTNKSPGVGLGLSLARETLRRAGGDLVLLESKKGALFQIRLPRQTASNGPST